MNVPWLVERLRLGLRRLAQLLASAGRRRAAWRSPAPGSAPTRRRRRRPRPGSRPGRPRRRRRASPRSVGSKGSISASGSTGAIAATWYGPGGRRGGEQDEHRGTRLLQRRLGEDLGGRVAGARDREHLDALGRHLGIGLLARGATGQHLGRGIGRHEGRTGEGLLAGSGTGCRHVGRRRDGGAHGRLRGGGCGRRGHDGRGGRRAAAVSPSSALPVQALSIAAQARAAARARRRVAGRGMEEAFRGGTGVRTPPGRGRTAIHDTHDRPAHPNRRSRPAPVDAPRGGAPCAERRRKAASWPCRSAAPAQRADARRTIRISGVPVASCVERPPSSTKPCRV